MTRLDTLQRTSRALLCTVPLLISACGTDDAVDDAAVQARRAELTALSDGYAAAAIDTIRNDAGAMQLAVELFDMHCADCHGADGSGDKGITDLTRGRFNYGTTEDAVRATIRDGRQSTMPRMGGQYGEVELGQIVAYLDTLLTEAPLNDYEARGHEFFLASCAACHGDDGQGLTALGASDLTDDYWQHGDSMMNKRLVITRGAQTECPARRETLTPNEIELLTAWVMHLADS
jgi:cytochrome c oxidase cbb3-type subunit 3